MCSDPLMGMALPPAPCSLPCPGELIVSKKVESRLHFKRNKVQIKKRQC